MQLSRPIRALESDWRETPSHDRAHAGSGQNLLLGAAINNMSSGLIVFDASERIVVCNRRYIEMFGLSPDVVKPGCSFDDLLSHRVARGTISGDIERYKRELRESLARNCPYSHTVRIPDGRYIGIDNQPLANGGWVGTYDDITDRRIATSELKRARAFLNTVVENVPVSVFVKDAKTLRYILVKTFL
jgi:PAS domain-containing protein